MTISASVRAQELLDRARRAAVAISLRVAPSEPQRLFGLTIAIGGICGIVAVAFHEAIQLAQELGIARAVGSTSEWAMLAVALLPALGGLLVGLFLQYVAPNAAGSGIPQIKVAYAIDTKGARLRDAIGKFVACTVQIGSGASLGREGPTVQICASIAVSLGRWLALSPASLRRLIPVGAAAGIAAAFNAPIAAVTFTIEEIVGTLDQTVLSGVVVAAALAAVVEHSMLGESPILGAPQGAGLHHASSLPFFACSAISSSSRGLARSERIASRRRSSLRSAVWRPVSSRCSRSSRWVRAGSPEAATRCCPPLSAGRCRCTCWRSC
jgi:H+/Cl- antiporter ClcA